MTWRNDPISVKQKDVLKGWGYKDIPKTKGEASDLIGKAKDMLHLTCRTCRKVQHLEVKGKTRIKVECCGITETFGKPGTPSVGRHRTMEELLFEMENKCTVEEAARFHFGDEAVDETLPNM